MQFLKANDEKFDLVTSADVFIYIGDIASVFRDVRRALRDGGLFCFSVESIDDADFRLRGTQRYAHSAAYLTRLAEQNRFSVLAIEPTVVRQEFGVNVDGYLATMRCR